MESCVAEIMQLVKDGRPQSAAIEEVLITKIRVRGLTMSVTDQQRLHEFIKGHIEGQCEFERRRQPKKTRWAAGEMRHGKTTERIAPMPDQASVEREQHWLERTEQRHEEIHSEFPDRNEGAA